MEIYVFLVFAFCMLEITRSTNVQWEVINEEQPEEDGVTEHELLTREQFLPYGRASRPKPKPSRLVIKEKLEKAATNGKDAQRTLREKNIKVPVLVRGPKRSGEASQGDEELLPLGVPHTVGRHLLELSLRSPVKGPTLPADLETRRLLEKFGADNLSAPCKDAVNDDCLFYVDSDLLPTETGLKANDRSVEDPGPLSRHPRQAGLGNRQSDDTSDNTDEGSGTSEDSDVYASQEDFNNKGKYKHKKDVSFNHSGPSLTDEEKEKLQKDLQKQVDKIMKKYPGIDIIVSGPKEENGQLVFDFEFVIDGSKVSAEAAKDGAGKELEDYLKDLLNDAILPDLQGLTVGGQTPDTGLGIGFVDDLLKVGSDYCGSEDPCPDVGPEYNRSACVNTGFMSGSCPHKCRSYPCQNRATCELNGDYMPICNCGKKFTGQYCEKAKAKAEDTGLTGPEKVGVGVAGAAAACAAACCLFVALFRRRNVDVNFSYYEDEGSQEQLSDPTIPRDFCIDRPIISRSPVSIFNPSDRSGRRGSGGGSSV